MVGCVDVQLAVDWQEELDGKRDCQQHAQLGKPHDPGAGVGVPARDRKEMGLNNVANMETEVTHHGMVAVSLKELFSLHLLLEKKSPANNTAAR